MTAAFPTFSSPAALLDAIYPWLVRQRWYPGEGQRPEAVYLAAMGEYAATLIVRLHNDALMHIPLAVERKSHNLVGIVCEIDGSDTAIVDGPSSPHYLRAWLSSLDRQDEGCTANMDPALPAQLAEACDSAYVIGQEQSNTSVVFDSHSIIVKFFRTLTQGPQPEVDVPMGLVKAGWKHVPKPLGATYAHLEDGTSCCTASMSVFIDGARDGFDYLCSLARSASRADHATAFKECRALGQVTSSMHEALLEAFGPGEFMSGILLGQRIVEQRELAERAWPDLAHHTELMDWIDQLIETMNSLGQLPPTQRVHGDFHLGQCLKTEDSWFVLDFEGEPLRPVFERCLPDQPVRDIAGMLRSIDYVAAMSEASPQWNKAARAAFVEGYYSHRDEAARTPDRLLINAMEVEKILYELRYEALHRPHLIDIPLHGLKAAYQRDTDPTQN